MEVLKDALLRNGFEYIGPCKVCGGRGFLYRRNRAEAKIKKDQHMNEVHITLNGFGDDGRRIINTLIQRKNEMHMANIDNIIQSNLGLIHVNSTEPTE
jgi:hypothetical protein